MTTTKDKLRVLIIGASRGIGAALTKKYAALGWEVHVTLRKAPAKAADAGLPEGVIIHPVDLMDREQIKGLGAALDGKPLNLLIVAAGVYDRVGGPFGNGPEVPPQEVFWVNSEAPILIAETVFENLTKAKPSKMVFVSSAEGIRGNGRRQGTYGQSKAALNDQIRQYAEEWAWYGVIGIALHPGWVRTDMGGAQAPLTPEQSASGIQQVIASLTPDHCGTFLDFRGNELPW